MDVDAPFTVNAFQSFLNEDKLMGVECRDCGMLYLPPKPLCSSCGSQNLTWREFAREGSVEAFTIIHIAPKRLIEEAPYVVAIVRIDNGPRITGRILGVETPEQVEVGSRVKVEFLQEEDGKKLAFKILR